jgi:methyltransferase-like protein
VRDENNLLNSLDWLYSEDEKELVMKQLEERLNKSVKAIMEERRKFLTSFVGKEMIEDVIQGNQSEVLGAYAKFISSSKDQPIMLCDWQEKVALYFAASGGRGSGKRYLLKLLNDYYNKD